jgi:hypothetical protein
MELEESEVRLNAPFIRAKEYAFSGAGKFWGLFTGSTGDSWILARSCQRLKVVEIGLD